MKFPKRSRALLGQLRQTFLRARFLLPRQRCRGVFLHPEGTSSSPYIGAVYVINLDRQPDRWRYMERELRRILYSRDNSLFEISKRVSAVDALLFEENTDFDEVAQTYSLGEQLFVDPRQVLPPNLDLAESVDMSRQEVAVALSHIDVWKKVAAGEHEYALILEDDVRFRGKFARSVDRLWGELAQVRRDSPLFDILYLSFSEVEYGAEKSLLSESAFKLYRGLWHLSGYVLSRRGADRLLERLPVRGPVDLWMNHQFGDVDALCSLESLIEQREDEASQNFYSILPVLAKIGVINSEGSALFRPRELPKPLFAIGDVGAGLSSIAMALSMLGYRCCSDLDSLPEFEESALLRREGDRVFDAYVNVGSVEDNLDIIMEYYIDSPLILVTESQSVPGWSSRWCGPVLRFSSRTLRKWKVLCEFLRTAPPACPFPDLVEIGKRRLVPPTGQPAINESAANGEWLQGDVSPWVARFPERVEGVPSTRRGVGVAVAAPSLTILFCREGSGSQNAWMLRSDTFHGNAALFCPGNCSIEDDGSAVLSVRKEDMGVREYSSAAITTETRFLFGRFSAVIKPAATSGVVTGIFLHRDSPRQEIDIEFLGNQPTKMLTNVYYNPGQQGDRVDYGYRGSPCIIELGFDFSSDYHEYAIEWGADEIRWLVDGRVVHSRGNWSPTPIPHLPMNFHVNLWPSVSRELAGWISGRHLPAETCLKSMTMPDKELPAFSSPGRKSGVALSS